VGGPVNGLRGGSIHTLFFSHKKAQKIIISSFVLLCFFVAQQADKLSKQLEEANCRLF
jgi:hypothetical protein